MRKTLVLLVLLAAPAQAEVVREMTPERIKEALAWGAAMKGYPVYPLKGSRGAALMTPFARVAALGQAAVKEYRPLDETSVTADLIEPYLEVYVSPHIVRFNYSPDRVIGVRRIVITGPKGSNPIQPIEETPNVKTFGNAMGGQWQAVSLRAKFPLDALRPGAVIHAIFDDGEDIAYVLGDLKGVR